MLRKYLPLSADREDNLVVGISAGGIGAAKLAYANPDRFAAAAILSIGPTDPADFCGRMPAGADGAIAERVRRIFQWFTALRGQERPATIV